VLILGVILAYFFFIFVLLRLIIPYLGFNSPIVPQNIPQDFLKVIADFNKKSKTDKEYLYNAYSYITERYHEARLKTIINWNYSFKNVFSHKSGYIPWNIHNFLLKVMLVKSGRFKEEDVKTQIVFFNFFIHQYLKVKLDNQWIKVDPNSQYMGIPFGKVAIWFG